MANLVDCAKEPPWRCSTRVERKCGTRARAELVRGVKVLVVDDNRTNLSILERMLARWGMSPTSVEGAEKALIQLSAAQQAGERFALILTDMHMPNVDGFTFIERARERPELSTATIMMLTSAGHRGDAARCQELGVAAYLLKPTLKPSINCPISSLLSLTARTEYFLSIETMCVVSASFLMGSAMARWSTDDTRKAAAKEPSADRASIAANRTSPRQFRNMIVLWSARIGPDGSRLSHVRYAEKQGDGFCRAGLCA
jgi:CheY-like chemotaxis protein